MFGIDGLDKFGLMHAAFGVASVLLGLGVVLLEKGTAVHRRIGLFYAASMLLLNATALAIYDLYGRFGPFHVLALVSLASIAGGVFRAWTRWPSNRWLELHANAMSWSYGGVLAAFAAEVTTRIPGVGFGWGVFVPSAGITLVAALLIHTRVRRLARSFVKAHSRQVARSATVVLALVVGVGGQKPQEPWRTAVGASFTHSVDLTEAP